VHGVAGIGGYEQLTLWERAEGLHVLRVYRNDVQQSSRSTARSCPELQQRLVLVRGGGRDGIQPNRTALRVHVRELRERQVQPSEHSARYTRHLVQRAAEQEPVLAAQCNSLSLTPSKRCVAHVEHAVLSQAAVLTRVERVQTHGLRLHVGELLLPHELLHAGGAADELSGQVDHGCNRF
jgi:hypothetical protein